MSDPRSEANIATLLAPVQPLARRLIEDAEAAGITIKVISGTRTYEEQDELYKHGRSKPGPRVTNAPGGHSNHNFGIAFDVGVFDGPRYIDDGPEYKKVGALGKARGLSWGGDWKSIQDEPHFELRPTWALALSESDMLAKLRDLKSSNTPIFA